MNPRHIKQLPFAQSKAVGPDSVCDRLQARKWSFNPAQFVDLLIEQQGNQGEEV